MEIVGSVETMYHKLFGDKRIRDFIYCGCSWLYHTDSSRGPVNVWSKCKTQQLGSCILFRNEEEASLYRNERQDEARRASSVHRMLSESQ